MCQNCPRNVDFVFEFIVSFFHVKTGRREKRRLGRNFLANLVNIYDILSIMSFCPAGPLCGNFHNKFTTFSLDFLPRRAVHNKFPTFTLDFFAPQGRSAGILITNLLLFHWILCPAEPLDRNFGRKFAIFSLDVLPRRAAQKEC